MSDVVFLLLIVGVLGGLAFLGYLAVKKLPKAPRPRAAALLVYMLAVLGGYVGVAWLAMLAWDHRQPAWVGWFKPLEFVILSVGTVALFLGIFIVPLLAGLVIWRFVALIDALRNPESKTPGYR